MDDIQSMLRDSANAVFGDAVQPALQQRAEAGEFAQALWRQVVEQGFTVALRPEVQGGSGLSWAQAYPLLHAAGWHAVPVPLPETMLGHYLLGAGGDPHDEHAVLSVAQLDAGQVRDRAVSGRVAHAPYARHADCVVVSADVDGVPHVGRIDLRSLDARQLQWDDDGAMNVAREPRVGFTLCDAPLSAWQAAPGLGPSVLLRLGAMMRAAQMAGAIERILQQTLLYSGERVQFGRPLAKFQAIQHHMAELGCEAAAAVAASAYACGQAGSGPAWLPIAAAKIRAGRAAGRAAALAHAVHGAIGFTYEHTLHYATRRLWSWRSEFGSHGWWSLHLGRAVCAGGPQAWWPAATSGELELDLTREA
ncbi:acyl-CoA dehydrogenase family protein [Bordetella genomosp. 13]|uniref:Acyl-CoA dehydrogenase n=1 Tax=Bordetella genomosp. 13 TaxID=463040 RepID=A0A1W6Z7W9_9BORD|nr:acyl-CoA dehydrogenase family protein [Bordetella genomosp. 13]ARP92924.1 hypothetical protein CAL15_00130 [Bordetella genomosp. 13]